MGCSSKRDIKLFKKCCSVMESWISTADRDKIYIYMQQTDVGHLHDKQSLHKVYSPKRK
jgi:hypothetical protein